MTELNQNITSTPSVLKSNIDIEEMNRQITILDTRLAQCITDEELNNKLIQERDTWSNVRQMIEQDMGNYVASRTLLHEQYIREKENTRQELANMVQTIMNKWFDEEYRLEFRHIESGKKSYYILVDTRINKTKKGKSRSSRLSTAYGGGASQAIPFIISIILLRTLGGDMIILDEAFSEVGLEAMEALMQSMPYLKDFQVISIEHYTNTLKYVDKKKFEFQHIPNKIDFRESYEPAEVILEDVDGSFYLFDLDYDEESDDLLERNQETIKRIESRNIVKEQNDSSISSNVEISKIKSSGISAENMLQQNMHKSSEENVIQSSKTSYKISKEVNIE